MEKESRIKPSLLVVCNSLHRKSETFILSHLMMVSAYFELSVLVHHSKVEIPNGLDIKEVIKLNIPKGFIGRVVLGLQFLAKDFNYLVKFLNLIKFGRNAKNFSLLLFASALGNRRFDLYHAHFGNNGVFLAQLKKAGIISGKVLTTFHGLDFTAGAYTSEYYKDLIKYGDKFIVVTDFSRNKLLALGFSENRLEKIPVGTDTDFFDLPKDALKSDTFSILFVGRLIPLKGVMLLADIARGLISKGLTNFKILVAGEGPLEKALKSTSESLDDIVVMKGYQSKSEIKFLMQKVDIFLYPGISDNEGRVENQCVTAQEAAASGLPIVASNIGGLPETVIEKKSGFLVTPGNIQEFVEKIFWLYSYKEERLEMGREGRRLVEKKFSSSVIDKQLLQLYSELCSQ